MESFENEYEEWFDKYLSEIESPHMANEHTPFLNAPRLFNAKKYMVLLSLGMIVSAILSFVFAGFDCKYSGWLSGIFSNLLIGLVGGLILLIYTNSKERTRAFYRHIIPILKKRLENLNCAYNYCWPKISKAYQAGDSDSYFKYCHYIINTECVIINFFEFLEDSISNQFRIFPISKEELHEAMDSVLKFNNELQKEYNNKKRFNNEVWAYIEDMQQRASLYPVKLLQLLEEIIEAFESGLYQIEFGKRKKF